MSDEWIIDVLSDLRAYARRQGLGATEAGLRDACLIAMAELADRADGMVAALAGGDEGGPGRPDRFAAEGDVA